MSSVLLLGFLIGLRHALEAGHLAAVATIATRTRLLARTLPIGALWGLGHSVTLAVGAGTLVLGSTILWQSAEGIFRPPV